MPYRVFSILILACFMAQPALAHRLNVYAWLQNDKIVVDSNFGANRPAMKAAVTVSDTTDKKELLTGRTDESGQFSFTVPTVVSQGHRLLITVDAGQGHQGQWTLDPSELYAAASLTAGFEAAALAGHTHLTVQPAPTAPLPASPLSAEQVQAIMGASLEKQLAPIHQELAALAVKGPGVAEIIGGLGWIIGLVGIGLYFKSRKA